MPILLAAVAHAQDAAPCKAGFTNSELAERVDSAANAVIISETEIARRVVARTSDDLACLATVVAPRPLADLGWLQAWLAFQSGDEAAARRWVRMAKATGGDEVPDFVPETHPFRAVVTEAVLPATASGRPLPPKGGGIFLDGVFLATMTAPADTPGFLQVADEGGRVVSGQWIDGATFPPELVGPPGGEAKAPKWWTGTASVAPVPIVAGARSGGGGGVPIVRVLATAGLAVVAGGMYGLAEASKGGLADATSEGELAGARTRVNTFAVGSAVVAAGAVGAGVTLFLGDAPGVGLAVRF